MKLTNKIQVTNIYKEVVTIEPIEYGIALKAVELMAEQRVLTNRFKNTFLELSNNNVSDEDIRNNSTLKNIHILKNDLEKEESTLRKNNNYWYCGTDNLDMIDKKMLLEKYNGYIR